MTVAKLKLTKAQRAYLAVIDQRGRLRQGWGGYSSTRTIRTLEGRGLVSIRLGPGPWEAQITSKGREALAARETPASVGQHSI